ncbi:MAG: PTS sugar transporter subunit IIA [Deltaproteobacteria bacterium]
MKVSDYLKKEFCITDLKAQAKQEVIVEIVECLPATSGVTDKQRFIADIMKREQLGSTGIGHNVAIPHSPTEGVEGFVVAFGRSAQGIDFDAIDGEKVNLIFLMGTNPNELNLYLKVLAKLSKLLNEESFRHELISAANPDEVVNIFAKYET